MKYFFYIGLFLTTLYLPENVKAQWVQVISTGFTSIATFDTTLYAGNVGGVFRSTNNGISWDNLNYTGGVSSIAKIDTIIFVGSNGYGVYRSSDKGMSWKSVYNGLTDTYIWGLAVNGRSLFALPPGGIFRSFDYGENWVNADSGLPNNARVYTIIPIGTNLFAATNKGLFFSNDGGTSWIAMKNDWQNTIITSLVRNGVNIYAGTNKGIFRSQDTGANWIQINTGLTDTLVNALVLNGTTLFAGISGSGGGVFRSSDSGAHWTFMSKDLPDSNITALALNDKYLFAGTDFKGVWRFPLSGLNAVNKKTSIPNGLVVYQNYPNPFSNQTTIFFSTDKREFVDVKIFDLLGKENAHIFSGELDAGNHLFQWNAPHLPSGVYTCIIRSAGGTTAEQQIIVN